MESIENTVIAQTHIPLPENAFTKTLQLFSDMGKNAIEKCMHFDFLVFSCSKEFCK